MAFVVFNLLAAAALIGIDQAIKLWATNVLQPIGAMPLIPHVVELRFVLNPGMAFSLLSGKQLFLIIATSIALIFVAYGLFFRSRGRYLQQAALLLILAGGIGNLIDRVLNGDEQRDQNVVGQVAVDLLHNGEKCFSHGKFPPKNIVPRFSSSSRFADKAKNRAAEEIDSPDPNSHP